jgi:hypothetical protein
MFVLKTHHIMQEKGVTACLAAWVLLLLLHHVQRHVPAVAEAQLVGLVVLPGAIAPKKQQAASGSAGSSSAQLLL